MTLVVLLAWCYILAILGFGMHYLTANHRLLVQANEAVLPFYNLHQPIILLIGYFVVALALPIPIKYLIITLLAFGATLGLYEYGIRRWNPVRRVFGLKPRRPAAGEGERRFPAPAATPASLPQPQIKS